MIVVDSSAIVAVVLREAEWMTFKAILDEQPISIGWPTILETRIVLQSKDIAVAELITKEFARKPNVTSVEFGEDHYWFAENGFGRFGRGSGHPAKLNYGDCMAYGVAKALGAPLLFKGGDFAKTDVIVHPASVT